jgi:hypothetical protein
MANADAARSEARDFVKTVSPTTDKWYTDTHGTLRDEVLNALRRCREYRQRDDIAAMVGMRGTVIERIDQVLADFLSTGRDQLPAYRTVLHVNVDALRGLAEVYGDVIVPRDVLRLAMKRAAGKDENDEQTQDLAILVLDHLEALDADQRVDRALRSELGNNASGALVLGLYWETDWGRARRDGILANARWQIPAEPYPRERARSTLYDHFVPYWEAKERCVFEPDAFDSILTLEPLVWFGATRPQRVTLPYLAVFEGRDAIRTAKVGGVAQLEHLARRAQDALALFRQEKALTADIVAYYTPALDEAASDLAKLIARPIVHDRGKLVLTRGHIICQLLGNDDHKFRYPAIRPHQPPFRSGSVSSQTGMTGQDAKGTSGTSPTGAGKPPQMFIEPGKKATDHT